ncbi:hypothetical protein [Streptomyces sp. Root264]|uniref:hypothetical protein n=1 Tax=Streptomyces sp. Root264 TaxID=1736503 RepID=UPI0018FE8A9F|nr:hypothetical protein [Streptomyces sp. Root264]
MIDGELPQITYRGDGVRDRIVAVGGRAAVDEQTGVHEDEPILGLSRAVPSTACPETREVLLNRHDETCGGSCRVAVAGAFLKSKGHFPEEEC